LPVKLTVDLFAGGGGASCGIEMATGRTVDLAINHDAAAVAMHRVNHPTTDHHVCDVFEVDPREVTNGRPVGLLWASPDCTYHSKARGAKPIRSGNRKRRALAWVVTRWAGQVRPRVIMLENVEEFAEWGPLAGPPDQLRPCPRRRGRTFRRWVRSLTRLGYQVEWRELRACDYGAPTIRKRLFVIARRDGQPIVWPEATHGAGRALPYRTAAECIDWSIPMLSIFATREEAKAWGRLNGQAAPVRPLAEATQRRIARGVMRYVVNNPRPFIVPLTHQGKRRVHPLDEMMPTVTGAQRGELGLVAPVLADVAHGEVGLNGSKRWSSGARSVELPANAVLGSGNPALVAPSLVHIGNGEREGQAPRALDIGAPLNTVVGSPKFGLVAAFLAQHNAGFYTGAGRPLDGQTGTVCAEGSPQALVAASLGTNTTGHAGTAVDAPVPTLATGQHQMLVAAWLAKYYGCGCGQEIGEPIHTIPTLDRFGVVTVTVDGRTYAVADIAMRMLQPRELYRAQGFPDSYVIDRGVDGRRFTKTEQVRMVGNSVSPPVAAALVRANCPDLVTWTATRATAAGGT
jgi:DNA (cytosine-5)-methyltransferase 1